MFNKCLTHHHTVPTAIAILRMVPVESDATPLSFANGLTEDFTLHRPFQLVPLETTSGEAHQFAAITRDDSEGEQFARHDIAFWIRPADGEGMVLMTTTLDLVKGEAMGGALAQLATGLRWG